MDYGIFKIIRTVLISVFVSLLMCVNVSAAPQSVEADGIMTVDLIFFAGQSNMSGTGGNASEAPAVPHGHGYEYRNGMDPAGMYEVVEPFGVRENGYLSDPDGIRFGTLVSAFMNKYYAATGVPVLGVSIARGGSALATYWTSQPVKAELVSKYDGAVAWCKANHVKIRKQYVVWLQGESDAMNGLDGDTYGTLLEQEFTPLFAKGLQQVFVITPGNLVGRPGLYDSIIQGQKSLCAKNMKFTLASERLHNLPDVYLADGIHYNQKALNMVGEEAATVAASYSKLH